LRIQWVIENEENPHKVVSVATLPCAHSLAP
jgi:hypothetical protein